LEELLQRLSVDVNGGDEAAHEDSKVCCFDLEFDVPKARPFEPVEVCVCNAHGCENDGFVDVETEA
jgi:hypothetical protein